MNYVIIDGTNEAHRAWMSTTDVEMTSDGLSTNAIFGFIKNLRYLITNPLIPCDRIIITWDVKGGSKRRKELYPLYKSQRKHDDNDGRDFNDFLRQMGILKQMIAYLPITQLELKDYEGDDLVAATCSLLDNDNKTIVSADKDFGQLVNEKTNLYKRGMFSKDHKLITPANFFQIEGKCKLPYNTLLDYKVLNGDSSDFIFGVDGVGDKTIEAMFGKYGTLMGALEHEDGLKSDPRLKRIFGPITIKKEGIKESLDALGIKTHIDLIMLNYKLMDLRLGLDYPVMEYVGTELLKPTTYNAPELKRMFAVYNFNSLLEKFDNFVQPLVVGTSTLSRFL